jgi:pyruvate/2-oxoglutarate dehydrogenase complex dihydrolipoamide dehydrogenase (E3) component
MVLDNVGTTSFVDPHTLQAENGVRVYANKIIISAGGTNRRLPVPGAELVGSHHDAWSLTAESP